MKNSEFKHWCRNKWFEHVEECLAWEGVEPTATSQEYFAKYKYWLKREFLFQRKNHNQNAC